MTFLYNFWRDFLQPVQCHVHNTSHIYSRYGRVRFETDTSSVSSANTLHHICFLSFFFFCFVCLFFVLFCFVFLFFCFKDMGLIVHRNLKPSTSRSTGEKMMFNERPFYTVSMPWILKTLYVCLPKLPSEE